MDIFKNSSYCVPVIQTTLNGFLILQKLYIITESKLHACFLYELILYF